MKIVLGTYRHCWVNSGLYCFVLHILYIQLFGPTLFQETALKSVNIWHVHREYITAFVVNELNPVQDKVARMRSALHKLDSFRNVLQCLPTQEGLVRRSMHSEDLGVDVRKALQWILTLRRLMSYIYIYIYIWSTHS